VLGVPPALGARPWPDARGLEAHAILLALRAPHLAVPTLLPTATTLAVSSLAHVESMKSGCLVDPPTVTRITARIITPGATGFAKMTAGLDASAHRAALPEMVTHACLIINAPANTTRARVTDTGAKHFFVSSTLSAGNLASSYYFGPLANNLVRVVPLSLNLNNTLTIIPPSFWRCAINCVTLNRIKCVSYKTLCNKSLS